MRRKDFLVIVSGSPPAVISIVRNLRMNAASPFLPFSPSPSLITTPGVGRPAACPLSHASLAEPPAQGRAQCALSAPAPGRDPSGRSTQPGAPVSSAHALDTMSSQRLIFHSERTGAGQAALPHRPGASIWADAAASVRDRGLRAWSGQKGEHAGHTCCHRASASKDHTAHPLRVHPREQVFRPSLMSSGQNRVLPPTPESTPQYFGKITQST